ncbi:hypothetical protein HDV06_006344 [Boothiomyces sp. JEL0866]|nr:hypothetical protein HDV06_006344 [Boothiomyces sp. JEL0866]
MFSIERSDYPYDPLNKPGYWGNATSTLDWCEPDYVVSYYIAEFFNTLTNLNYILLGFLALYSALKVKLEKREHSGTAALVVIGIGSWLFHMTLLYYTQLCDELPMIYGTCLCLYNVLTLYGKHSKKSIIGLILYSVVITIVYVILRIPLLFQVSYALLSLVFAIVPLRQTFQLRKKHPKDVKILLRMYCFNLSMYLLAFLLWNGWRDTVPWYLGMFSQTHGWWHMLTGLGCYGQIVHCRYLRCLVKGKPVKLIFYGPYPTLIAKEQDLENPGDIDLKAMDRKSMRKPYRNRVWPSIELSSKTIKMPVRHIQPLTVLANSRFRFRSITICSSIYKYNKELPKSKSVIVKIDTATEANEIDALFTIENLSEITYRELRDAHVRQKYLENIVRFRDAF